MNIGEKIKLLRTSSGLSQESVAALLNVSRQSVSKWEKGLSKPSTENLLRLSEIFKVSVEDMVDENITLNKYYNTTHYFSESIRKKTFFVPFCILIILSMILFCTSVYLRDTSADASIVFVTVSASAICILSAFLLFESMILRYVYLDCKIRNIKPFWYISLSVSVVGLAFYLLYRDEISDIEKRRRK